MTSRIFIAAVVCVLGATAAPMGINDIPEQYREMIPKELQDFLSELTDADKMVLKDWARNYASYQHEGDALLALKAKSPSLGERAEKLHNMVMERIEKLQDEAKVFAKEMINGVRKLQAQIVAGEKPSMNDLKSKAAYAAGMYRALSPSAKDDLHTQFPIITTLMKNEKFQKMAESFVGKNN